jgi:hypothetical protein
MITRHTNELLQRLEQVEELGSAVIRKPELLRWNEKEKLMKSVWRNIYDKWVDLEFDSPLFIADGDGFVTLLWGKGMTTSEDSWFDDIREWAGLPITA